MLVYIEPIVMKNQVTEYKPSEVEETPVSAVDPTKPDVTSLVSLRLHPKRPEKTTKRIVHGCHRSGPNYLKPWGWIVELG